MKKLLFTVIILFGLVMNAYSATPSADQKIAHVAIIWLNNDMSAKQIADIIDKTNILSTIEVVQDFKIGKPVITGKKAVDESFTFVLSMSFKDHEAFQHYLQHDIHNNYVKTVLKPVLKKAVIYDYK